jgi:hypothetical protein
LVRRLCPTSRIDLPPRSNAIDRFDGIVFFERFGVEVVVGVEVEVVVGVAVEVGVEVAVEVEVGVGVGVVVGVEVEVGVGVGVEVEVVVGVEVEVEVGVGVVVGVEVEVEVGVVIFFTEESWKPSHTSWSVSASWCSGRCSGPYGKRRPTFSTAAQWTGCRTS